MKKLFLFFLVLVFSCATAFATWSIIIIDRKTHEIGIAGAIVTELEKLFPTWVL